MLNVNDPPTANPVTAFSVLENATVGFVVGTLVGADIDLNTTLSWTMGVSGSGSPSTFAVSAPGTVTVASRLFYLTQASYWFVAIVSDGQLVTTTNVTVCEIARRVTRYPLLRMAPGVHSSRRCVVESTCVLLSVVWLPLVAIRCVFSTC